MIEAKIVAHSVNKQGDELMSVLCTFPRIILAEVNTHRMLSKNTSSSRAIPFNKMVEAIRTNPFIPIAWQKEHSGMQGSEYFAEGKESEGKVRSWLRARDNAVQESEQLTSMRVTKQLANRLLEPFMWTTMLITGPISGWENFFELRCPAYRVGGKGDDKSSVELFKSKKDAIKIYPFSFDEPEMNWRLWNEGQAEIHIMDLAEKVYDAYKESNPVLLQPGQWHLPFEDKIFSKAEYLRIPMLMNTPSEEIIMNRVKISVAMAARTSYTVVGNEKEIDFEAMIGLHDRLLSQDPPHSSPMEHCCLCVDEEQYNNSLKGQEKGWFRNYKGFKSYRQIIEETK